MTMTIDQPKINTDLPQKVEAQRREIRVVNDTGPIANLMDTARFEHLQRLATLMSASSLLPQHLCQVKIKGQWEDLPPNVISANCFRIVNQALRWNMDPFAIVDETYVVGGKLGYQGKLVAAVVNSRGGLRGRLSYDFHGVGNERTVVVRGTFDGEETPREATLRLGDARTANEMWSKDPDQKLIYSGVVKWARRFCPEVVLGVLTEDDIERIRESSAPEPEPQAKIKTERLVEKLRSKGVGNGAAAPEPVVTPEAPAPDPQKTNPLPTERHDPTGPVAAPPANEPSAGGTQAETKPPQSAATAGGNGGDSQLDEHPVDLPDEARKSEDWIHDRILKLRPEGMAARSARNTFHALHAPHSWANVPPEKQDDLWELLRTGRVYGQKPTAQQSG